MKTRILLLVFSISLLLNARLNAQHNNTSTVQLEALGAYNLAGISFDRRFSDIYSGFGYKVGIGAGYANAPWTFVPFKYNTWGSFPKNRIVSVPLQMNYLLGRGNSQFEAGAGVTPFYSTYKFNEKSNMNAYGTMVTGYRFHSTKSNLAFGAGIMYGFKLPRLKINHVDNFFWQPYFSIGYMFGK